MVRSFTSLQMVQVGSSCCKRVKNIYFIAEEVHKGTLRDTFDACGLNVNACDLETSLTQLRIVTFFPLFGLKASLQFRFSIFRSIWSSPIFIAVYPSEVAERCKLEKHSTFAEYVGSVVWFGKSCHPVAGCCISGHAIVRSIIIDTFLQQKRLSLPHVHMQHLWSPPKFVRDPWLGDSHIERLQCPDVCGIDVGAIIP